LRNYGGFFDFEAKISQVKALETKMSEPDFWNNQEFANKTIRELKYLKNQTEPFVKVQDDLKAVRELLELAENSDQEILHQINLECNDIVKILKELEINLLLSGKQDSANAFLSIHAGAGGTESCDWAEMLFRMYSRWSQENGFGIETIDFLQGDGAGIKSVTVLIKGDFAYGKLKGENGVHRLVRISPFDSNKRRHTSFASVEVIPEIDQDINIDLRDEDIRIDIYRASGPGGQGVNTTDSAIRIVHLPTGIIVQCQNERSQLQNKATAIKMLKSKLYELELKQRREDAEKEHQQKRKIEWGSQIRSYVMHPYSLVKDHRTQMEKGDVQGVMDGKIDSFIEAFLKWNVSGNR